MRGKLPIIIALIVVVVAVLGGGAYWFVLKPQSAVRSTPVKKEMEFVSLDPMVVSVHEQGQFGLPSDSTYLQVGFEFATDQTAAVNAFQKLRPAIRGNVLALLLKLSPDVLHDEKARNKMKEQVLAIVNRTLAGEIDKPAFDKVYITLFVTQPG